MCQFYELNQIKTKPKRNMVVMIWKIFWGDFYAPSEVHIYLDNDFHFNIIIWRGLFSFRPKYFSFVKVLFCFIINNYHKSIDNRSMFWLEWANTQHSALFTWNRLSERAKLPNIMDMNEMSAKCQIPFHLYLILTVIHRHRDGILSTASNCVFVTGNMELCYKKVLVHDLAESSPLQNIYFAMFQSYFRQPT